MPDQAPWLPLLAVPFDATVPATPEVDAIGPAFRRRRLHEVVEQFLTRVLLMPTLFVVEDTHWLDDASRELLGALLAEPAMRPWLVCTTRRPAGAALAQEDREDHVVLALAPLDAEATALLALAADEELTLGEEDLSAVSARSGGNPLFVRELVAAASAGSSELPETVERLMTERIDTLPADDRLMLRYASVVGQWFDLDVLRELGDGELQDVTDIGRWHRLSDFVERGAEDAFFFRHELFRVAAYEGLSFRRRREIHGLVGEVLEQRFAGRTDEAAGLLSHHFVEAGDGPLAWHYSVVAGRRARSRFANVDATEFFARALRAADELGAASPLEVAEIAEALGDVCELSARYEDARTAYRRARAALADDPGAQLRLTRKEGTLLERLGHYDEAVAWFERALEAAPRDDDAHALRDRGARARVRGRPLPAGALRGLFSASARRPRRGPSVSATAAALAHAYRLLDSADRALGGLDESWLAKALPIYEELGDPIGRAITLNNWGIRAYYAGRWDDAQAYYEQSREAEHTSGDVVRAATASNNEAEILLDQGHTDRAAGLFQDALRVYRASGYTFGAAVVLLNLARSAAAAGRFDEAHRLFDQAHGSSPRSARRASCSSWTCDGPSASSSRAATPRRSSSRPRRSRHPRRPGRRALGLALLERVRGYAHIQARRPEEGRLRLEASLAAARESGNDFEAALTLRALSLAGSPEYRQESDDLLRRLGVVSGRTVPLP